MVDLGVSPAIPVVEVVGWMDNPAIRSNLGDGFTELFFL